MTKPKLLIASAILALGVVPASRAQMAVEVDMSKFTCEQLLQGSSDAVEAAIWLSGYYNGLRKNTKLNLGQFEQNAKKIVEECHTNPKKTVMQTVNTLLAAKK